MHTYWTMMETAFLVAIAVTIVLARVAEKVERRTSLLMLTTMPAIALMIMLTPFIVMGTDGSWWEGPGARTIGGSLVYDALPVVAAATVLGGMVHLRRRRKTPGERGLMEVHLSLRGTMGRSAYLGHLIRIGLIFGSVTIWTVAAGIFYVDSVAGTIRHEGSDAHGFMANAWAAIGLASGTVIAVQRLRDTVVPPACGVILPLLLLAGLGQTAMTGAAWWFVAGCAAYLLPAMIPPRTAERPFSSS